MLVGHDFKAMIIQESDVFVQALSFGGDTVSCKFGNDLGHRDGMVLVRQSSENIQQEEDFQFLLGRSGHNLDSFFSEFFILIIAY